MTHKLKLLRGPLEIKLPDKEIKPYFNPHNSKAAFRVTDIALYSSFSFIIDDTNHNFFAILKTLIDIPFDTLVSLDLGSCIGGITKHLLKYTKSVYAIEYEPLHVDISYDNLSNELSKDILHKLKLYLGDVEKIFDDIDTTFRRTATGYIKETFNCKPDFVYIGTPFIDLRYGNMLVENLIMKIMQQYRPILIVVHLPGNPYKNNPRHTEFFQNALPDLIKSLTEYEECSILDVKRGGIFYNQHYVFIRKDKCSTTIKKQYYNHTDITYIWKSLYSQSYYINASVNNKSIRIKTIERDSQNKIPFKTTTKYIDLPDINTFVVYGKITDKYKPCKLYMNRFKETIDRIIVSDT